MTFSGNCFIWLPRVHAQPDFLLSIFRWRNNRKYPWSRLILNFFDDTCINQPFYISFTLLHTCRWKGILLCRTLFVCSVTVFSIPMPLNKSWYSAEGLVTLLSLFIHCANPRSDAIRIRKGSVGPFYQMKLANIMLCFCFHMDSQGSVSLQWITSSTWN